MTEVKKGSFKGEQYDKEGFRISTPLEIALHKAQRLKTGTIADLGAGIGIQAINFASFSDRVMAVERDRDRLEACRRNAMILGIDNIDFILGDALSDDVIKSMRDVDIIHSDPSRKRTGDSWSFTDLYPNPTEILKKYKKSNFSFDIPSLFERDRIPVDWEMEYISLEGELKRLSIYGGSAWRYSKSALILPGGARLVENKDIDREIRKSEIPNDLIHELDPSIQISGLLPEFLDKEREISFLYSDKQRTLVTGSEEISSPYILKTYRNIDRASSLHMLRERLREVNAKKVFLRFPVKPSRYYQMKKELEKDLAGERDIFVFKINGIFFLTERTDDT